MTQTTSLDFPTIPVHSYHMLTTNRDFVLDSIQRCLKPYGYFKTPANGKIPQLANRHRFYISAVHKGWISITDNQYFARWELARRSSMYIPGKVVLCWADPGEGWGYQYWNEGTLVAEFVSDMMELHREWFEEEPSMDEIGRFSGNPQAMKEAFGSLGFSLRDMKHIYPLPGSESMRALREFGEQLGLEDGLLNFPGIDELPVEERLGVRGFHYVDYFEKYQVNLDDPAKSVVEFPEDVAPAEA